MTMQLLKTIVLFSRKVGFINGQWLMLWIIQCHNATLQVHFVTDVMTVRQYIASWYILQENVVFTELRHIIFWNAFPSDNVIDRDVIKVHFLNTGRGTGGPRAGESLLWTYFKVYVLFVTDSGITAITFLMAISSS